MIAAACAYAFTDFTLPAAAIRPGVVLVLGIYTVLGLLLWNAFNAAVASTIDDPNASGRSALIMLPFLPAAMSMALVRDPDSWLARALALCPLTSAPAMPVRLVLSDPGFFEIGTSLVLLCAAIWIARNTSFMGTLRWRSPGEVAPLETLGIRQRKTLTACQVCA